MIKVLINNLTEISHCIVFSGGEKPKPEEIFSTIELAKIDVSKTEFIYSNMTIFEDDSIRIIKKKILKELTFFENISYDELYLYYESSISPSVKEIYNNVTNNGKNILYDYIFKQTLFNFKYNISNKNFENVGHKDIYDYNDFVKLELGKDIKFNKPLGMDFSHYTDYSFSANPLDIFYGSEEGIVERKAYENSSNNLLLNMDNNLLLNYKYVHNNIYLVIAPHLLEKNNTAVQSHFIDLYYPFLKKQNINNYDDLMNNKTVLIKKTKDIMKDKSFKYYDNIHLLHKIYEKKTNEINYLENGFNEINFIIHPKFKTNMPLENIFKLIHCSLDMPLIRFNPGKRKDNIFRVYSTYTSRTGKKIPLYSKNVITALLKQPRKHNSLSFYIKNNEDTLIVDLLANSSMIVNYNCKKILNIKQIEKVLRKKLNIIVNSLNTILLQSGFSIIPFENFQNENIELSTLKYYIYFESPTELKINKCKTLFSHIFDSLNIKNQNLIYKRVENFKKMDAINTTINTVYKETNNEKIVIKTLMENNAMTEEDAINKMNAFFDSYTRINGKYVNKSISIAENPGFPTKLRFIPFENKSYFEIENITNLKYIQFINIYIDSLLRIIYGKSYLSGVSITDIDELCKEKKVEDESHVDVVVMTVPNDDLQPMIFVSDENEVDDDDDDDDDGIFFIDDDDDEDSEDSDGEFHGGKGTPNKIDPSSIDGMSLTRPNIFFQRLTNKDPSLFLTKSNGKFDSYSRMCLHSQLRQPVLLTQEEKDYIDTNHPGSYRNSLSYGSDPKKQHHYICPRYWCLLTNTSITDEEVKTGKCGKIIPFKSTHVPKGHYVFEFNHPKVHRDSNEKYINHSPGFLSKDSHPDNKCIPCCFKEWTTKKGDKETVQDKRIKDCNTNTDSKERSQKPKERAKQNITALQYIIGFESFPLPDGRYGFLHPGIEHLLNIDYKTVVEAQNPAFIKKNNWTTLRFGCENSENKSFMGCFAELHRINSKVGYKWTIQQLCDNLSENINLDDFVRYNNGSLVSSFKNRNTKIKEVNLGPYKDTKIYKSMNKMDEVQLNYLEEIIIALENFKEFIKNPKSSIDHTFMWDLLCDEQNPLNMEPVNLIILEMDFSDITNNVNILCPSNAYSNHVYDETRKNFILIKNGPYYELLSRIIFESKETSSVKGYHIFDPEEPELQGINTIMKTIVNSMKHHCTALDSKPNVYKYEKNMEVKNMIKQLLNVNYEVEKQVINYQNKVIGLIVKLDKSHPRGFFVPTQPSMINKKIEYVNIDHDIWDDYKTTISNLKDLNNSNKNIKCLPRQKVIEDGMIVGLLTETNQFVQIVPPYQNIDETYKIKLDTIHETNHILADRQLNTSQVGDKDRVTSVRNINLENNFYNAFKNIVRILIHKRTNNELFQQLKHFINHSRYLYKTQITQITKIIEFVIIKFIDFVEFDDNILNDIDQITTCFDNDLNKKYCTLKKDVPVLLIPNNNLISGEDNKTLYIERLADEFIRNKTIQHYLLEPESSIHIYAHNYVIHKDEFIILQHLLSDNYFDNIIAISKDSISKLNNFDLAQPSNTQYYTNKIVHKEELNTSFIEKNLNCIQNISKTILQPVNGKWNSILSFKSNEILFKRTNDYCSFGILQFLYGIYTQKYISIIEIKNKIWNSFYFLNMMSHSDKIYNILEKQGKKDMIKEIKSGKRSLNSGIKDDNYFITDLDVWAFFTIEKIPVILFSETNFQSMMSHTNWIINGDTLDKKHYFIRTNKKYEYSIVETPIELRKLTDFTDKMKTINQDKSDDIIYNNINIKDYLELL